MAPRTFSYESSHPWITFSLDMRALSWRAWMMLGEAQSKCEHIAGVPLRPDVAREVHSLYMAKGAHATTAIEGNTLTEAQVRRQIEGVLDLPASKDYLAREISNVAEAFNSIVSWCVQGDAQITTDTIREYNLMLLDGLPGGEDVIPGQIRTHSVMVMDYRGAPAQDCQMLLDRLCDWLNGPNFQGTPENLIAFAILRGIVAHLYLAWIHPFGDGNGRTARLLEFQILVMGGVPTPAAHLLSNYYNETRAEYYRQLSFASQSGGNIFPFIEYALRGFVEGLREQLGKIREQQWLIAWRDFVFRSFDNKKSPSDDRRRRLALALPYEGQPIDILHAGVLTPELAQDYRGKSDMTIRRDLTTLVEMNLIRKVKGGYLANRDQILQFLPTRADPAASKTVGQTS